MPSTTRACPPSSRSLPGNCWKSRPPATGLVPRAGSPGMTRYQRIWRRRWLRPRIFPSISIRSFRSRTKCADLNLRQHPRLKRVISHPLGGLWHPRLPPVANDAEAVKAINALNGTDLEGRTPIVPEVRPRTDRPRSDRPGGKVFHPFLGFPAYTSILQRLCVYTARYFPCWSNGITATNARPLAVSFIAVSKAVRYCFDIKSAVISSTAYCDDVDWA